MDRSSARNAGSMSEASNRTRNSARASWAGAWPLRISITVDSVWKPQKPEIVGDRRSDLPLVLHPLEERRQVFGMLLFAGEYFLQQAVRGRILIAEIGDHFAIALDRDSLGNQIFLDHALERIALDVFRMAAGRQPVRREIRLAAELDNALGDEVGM